MRTPLEVWSRDYVLAPTINVDTYNGDKAIIDEAAYAELVAWLGEPIIGRIGGLHYHLAPSSSLLSERCAVPKHNHRDADDQMAVLLSR